MTLETIRADFDLLDDWEDRYRYVIELGRTLEPLPEGARSDANKVRGCASQVWLASPPTVAASAIAGELVSFDELRERFAAGSIGVPVRAA